MAIDTDLESRIDAVGRQRVFQRARLLGWGPDTPPKWVWENIILELQKEDAGPVALQEDSHD